MQTKIIRQKYDKEGTWGKLYIDGDFDKHKIYTLERPNLGNQRDDPKTKANDSSCIPEGKYQVVRDRTGKFKYFALLDVPNRSNIEWHPANSIDDLLGCLSSGDKISENIYGYKYWLHNSKKTMDKLIQILPEKFWLEITSADSLCK